MAEQPNVLTFPKGNRRTVTKDSDEKLVADIRIAWRRLGRCILKARDAGLTIEADWADFHTPIITRRL